MAIAGHKLLAFFLFLMEATTVADGLQTPKGGVVIFCHGSGDSGKGVKRYVEHVTPSSSQQLLKDSGIGIEYPDAKLQPYRLMGGYPLRIWFNRYGGMDPSNPEDTASVEESANNLNDLIDTIIEKKGIPPGKIAIGGFSMGGGIALQTVARRQAKSKLGAVFALSSYLCDDSKLWTQLENKDDNQNNGLTCGVPVFMAHGTSDSFVEPQWGKTTATKLEKLGVNVQPFVDVPGAGHEMTREELEDLFQFLARSLK